MPPPGGVSEPGQWSQSASPGFTPEGPPAQGYQYGGPAGAPGGPPPEALAGFWIRLAARLLDGVLLWIAQIIISIPLALGFRDNAVGVGLGLYALSLLLSLGYFTYLHGSAAGQTIGDRACGIRIADADSGGSIPYSRALIRVLMSYVSSIPFALGFFWMLWQPRKQTWHDLVANTLVVKTSFYPAHR